MEKTDLSSIPVATVCFEQAGPSHPADYIFTACNAPFVALFGGDFSGLLLSRVPRPLLTMFERLGQMAAGANPQSILSDGRNNEYDVRLQSTPQGYTACFLLRSSHPGRLEEQVHRVLEQVTICILLLDRSGKIIYMNRSACALIGSSDWGRGGSYTGLFDLVAENSKASLNILELDRPGDLGRVLLCRADGTQALVTASVTPAEFRGGRNLLLIMGDLSEQKRREDEVAYLSYHDKLTGLYNRAYFEKMLKELDREANYPISIILGDANGLKMTNDIFGHRKGDQMLVNIADILSLTSRENDIVARYGGDEFVVLMPGTAAEEAAKVSRHILSLCDNYTYDQNKVSLSLGYSCKTSATQDINDTLNIAENYMYRHKLLESRSYRSSVISSLKKMLFERSFETEEHAMRLTGLCVEAGRRLGLSENDLSDLNLFSMLHDIGKIGITDRILLKPASLTDAEWVEMKKHCEIGYRIAQSAPELSHIADYILSHHERWDGTGYPQGQKGTQIPLLSRILAVADSYDAMVNNRHYRKALTREMALDELRRGAGTQFDPDIVRVFLDILSPPGYQLHPVGRTAAL